MSTDERMTRLVKELRVAEVTLADAATHIDTGDGDTIIAYNARRDRYAYLTGLRTAVEVLEAVGCERPSWDRKLQPRCGDRCSCCRKLAEKFAKIDAALEAQAHMSDDLRDTHARWTANLPARATEATE